ncbi:YidC/Oxa1 family membrane protein insertase [Micromonospora carbonacea]|uniref:Membrane protein insertase YidC n=1 Tax=Micromonospora carbonacea TaxID=47853 RepID=A0A7H8XSQ6_9ACTN|nr:membrane protein insertase YidC [Micromonospora carbonacea]MBB5824567.1 YidC/Oxa1 family membrane protein insertase [Micromonospora carbonacea]QLD27249.1 membrane protein insertase YidC [Micromonospora carbonacea]
MLAFAPLHAAAGVAADAVTWLAGTLQPLTGGAATAAAIVVFTIAVRLLISPLTLAQVRGERRRAALAPQVRDLQRRHADDPTRLQAELFGLYRSAGASPVAGCLPALLQAPFFLVMYRLFSTGEGSTGDGGTGAGGAGAGLLAEQLAGVPLGWHLSDGLAGAAGPLFGALLAALVALAWWSSRRARRAAAAGAATAAGTGPGATGGTPAGTPAGAAAAGAVPAVLGRVLPLLPYLTVVAALVVPLAAVLYLVTTTAWTALEQAVLRRPQVRTGQPLDRNS